MALQRVEDYLRNSRSRASQSPSVGPGGLVSSNYRALLSGHANRYRTNYVPRNLSTNLINLQTRNPLYNTYKITLPMGTVMFRAASMSPDPTWNMQKTKFHYFTPLGGLAVVGYSQSYNRFCMFALKYDTSFFLLLQPGDKTKKWVTMRGPDGLVQLDKSGKPINVAGVDDGLNKNLCRAAGVQGWIGLSGEDAHAHKQLAARYPAAFPPSISTNESKFVHTNSYLGKKGVYGFPECVMWYQDLQYKATNKINKMKKMVIEPIVCLHMPSHGTEAEKLAYLEGFYNKVITDGLIEKRTHAVVSGGGTIPFAHFVFPDMSTPTRVQQFLARQRADVVG